MRILFPRNPINEKEADAHFQEEYTCFKALGVNCSLFDFDALILGEIKPKPRIENGEKVIYRGWMVDTNTYAKLVEGIIFNGGTPYTTNTEFISSHHLPEWYENLKEFTAETHFFEDNSELIENAKKLNWDKYFVKDYVKSNYDEIGSIAVSPEEVRKIVDLIKKYRGNIEGGISLRMVEAFRSDTEKRFFVLNGKAFSPKRDVPDLVRQISDLHKAPFYSVDTIEFPNGELCLVELGDGQVSDIKTWPVEHFCKMVAENA